MGRIKSDNHHLALLAGYETQWVHSPKAETITITPRSGEPVLLLGVDVNTTSASAVIVRDSAVGVIATLKASIAEGSYLRPMKLRGNLIVENPGGSDLTIRFHDR